MSAVATRPRCRLPMRPRDGKPQFCGRAANHPGNHLSEQAYQRLLEAKRKAPLWSEALRQEMLREMDELVAMIRRQPQTPSWPPPRTGRNHDHARTVAVR